MKITEKQGFLFWILGSRHTGVAECRQPDFNFYDIPISKSVEAYAYADVIWNTSCPDHSNGKNRIETKVSNTEPKTILNLMLNVDTLLANYLC